MKLSFIGSAGVPNRYGGFESFLEHCGPLFAEKTQQTIITCDESLYHNDLSENFHGVIRKFIRVRANGASSILHDLVAFFCVFRESTHIVILGVSGGLWFPLFFLLCKITGKRLGVNIDGVEWRRAKYGVFKKTILRFFDFLAQYFSNFVVYDNAGLLNYVLPFAKCKAFEIAYSGDHVLRLAGAIESKTALTICRIEPENNIEMLIEGVLKSSITKYTIVGNWSHSEYGLRIREKYNNNPILHLVDPIYDSLLLAQIRESCAVYLHGHSVGGTNPSLVEMIFYDCEIICYDVIFNRATIGDCANYFSEPDILSMCIDFSLANKVNRVNEARQLLRSKYSRDGIVNSYLIALNA